MSSRIGLLNRSMRFGILTWKDIIERSVLKVRDRFGLLKDESYMRKASEFLRVDCATLVRMAQQNRKAHKNKWAEKKRRSEMEYQAFYSEDDWYIYFYPYVNRTMTWHYIDKMKTGPKILEYGCGPASMTQWLLKRYPKNRYAVADLSVASTMKFIRQIFEKEPVDILEIGVGTGGLPLKDMYDLIVCTNVLEHTINPDEIVGHLYEHLNSGGVLYTDFMQASEAMVNQSGSENLAEAVQKRDATITFMETHFVPVKSIQRASSVYDWVGDWDMVGIYKKKIRRESEDGTI
jgi:SAM-dependent methyltransferase